MARKDDKFPRAQRPCPECPWVVQTPPGQFPAERYEVLRATSPRAGVMGNPMPGDPMFACHKSPEGQEWACAGWLASQGAEHVGVRLAVAFKKLDPIALDPQPGWPELYSTYEEMVEDKVVEE
jgi:Family of unknown function (DUF6283)